MKENFSKQLLSRIEKNPNRQILHVLVNGEYVHLTYSELLLGAKKYQFALDQAGILSTDVVILILMHGLDLIYAYFGTILNGSIPSIMPYLTEKLFPDKYKQDLRALIDITKPKAVITYKEFIQEIGFLENFKPSIKAVVLTEDVSQISS